jgi:hypothetical protein
MRQFLPIPILLLFLFSTASVAHSQEKNVVIRIVQDQSTILSDFETHLLLQKKPFRIQVLLENIKGVYVFASIRDSVYRFTATDTIQDFIYLPMLELREDRYNTEKELNISQAGWSNWYYDPEGDHPFNAKVYKLDNNRTVCTKYVKQLFDVSEGRQIRIKDVTGTLYLFFVAVEEYDSNGKPAKELIRKKAKIEWIAGDDD